MQIYAEYAFLENFCMDFTLLYSAKAAAKNPGKTYKVALSAALGAAFAVVYPLFGVERLVSPWGTVVGLAVKLAAGAVMCALSGKFTRFKGYLKFTALFAAFSFLLGGALIALFSLTGADYKGGGGYILSSVPIGIPMFFALILVVIVKKVVSKIRVHSSQAFVCTVYLDGKSAKIPAFYDSGNKVYYGGSPVSIIPENAAKKLIDVGGIKTFTDIHTVSGKGRLAVFKADKVEIDDGKEVAVRKGVLFGVSPNRICKIVMHPDVAEVN